MSKLGICSRREAERWIRDARVAVAGHVVLDPRQRVDLERDRLRIDRKKVEDTQERVVIALHKPVGIVTTRVDERGRLTVYDLLVGLKTWVFPVGRLDRDSSGLLILTNDHRLGQSLTDPDHDTPKAYHVRVKGVPSPEALRRLRGGVELRDGTTTRPAKARIIGVAHAGQAWLEIVLSEGKNRQVRRMCATVGHDVLELVRVSIGGLTLDSLAPGSWRRLTSEEIARLTDRDARRR